MRGLRARDIKRTGTTARKLASRMEERIERIEDIREVIFMLETYRNATGSYTPLKVAVAIQVH